MIEINLTKMKKGTGTKKVTVRKKGVMPFIQEFASGQKVPVKKTSGRAGTGKIDKLPQNIKNTIIELRNGNYTGSQIKEYIETMIQNTTDPETQRKLVESNVIKEYGTATKLTVTPQALTDYAKKHGAKPTSVRGPRTVKSVQAQEKARHEDTKKDLSEADKTIARLETELRGVKDRIAANRVDEINKQKVRKKLRADLIACKEKLKA